jgi:restriction system protein
MELSRATEMPDSAVLRDAFPRRGRSLLVLEDANDEAKRQQVIDVAERMRDNDARISIAVTSRRADWPLPWTVVDVGTLTQVEAAAFARRFYGALTADDRARLVEVAAGFPLTLKLLGEQAQYESIDSVIARVRAQRLPTQFPADAVLPGPDLFPHPATPAQQEFDIRVAAVSDELIHRLSANPQLMYELHPRRFEELIAELYARQGFEVELTKQTRDGGVDIYVVETGPLGRFTTLVDVKRNRRDRPVGIGVVRQLYGVVEARRATAGIIATTSFFSPDAKRFQQDVEARMTGASGRSACAKGESR